MTHDTQLFQPSQLVETENFIGFLWRGGQWGNYWSKQTFWMPAGSPAAPPESGNVYFGVHPTSEIPKTNSAGEPASPENVRSRNAIIAAVNCLFAEFDAKDFDGDKAAAYKHVLDLDPMPSAVIDSGGGYHAYWFLDHTYQIQDELDRDSISSIQARWVDFVGGDPGAKDLARILRVPGTKNHKYNPPRPVEFIFSDFGLTYVLEDLEQLLPPAESRRPESSSPSPRNYSPSASHWLEKYLPQAYPGMRDKTCYSMCQQMFWDDLPLSEAISAAREFARNVQQPAGNPYTEQRAERTCKSAYTSGERPPARGNGTKQMSDYRVEPLSGQAGEGIATPQPAEWDIDGMPPIPEPPEEGPFLMPPEIGETNGEAEQLSELSRIMLTETIDHEGHARCVIALYPGKFAYSEHLGWMFYNGRYWQREGGELRAERAVVDALKARRLVAVQAENEILVKATRANRSNVTGTRDQLKSLAMVDVNEFDASPDLLNCHNGVLDLQTGELVPHNPEQKFTYCIPVDYDRNADPAPFLDFLREATAGAGELVEYIKLALGYSLTGHTWEEVLFYVYGPTRSGKGTFTETILRLLGNKPLAVETDFQTFTASREGDTQNFDLAPLKPCRFVAASESNKNQPLNPAKVKQVTGGNYVWCAFKHREHFGYRPQFKIWLSSNHPVNVDVDDNAAWARVRVISFPNSHLGREDKSLKQRLASPEVLRGVLAWAVDGAREWYTAGAAGLPLPDCVKRITQSQRAAQDFIQQFLDEMTESGAESWIHSGALHKAYRSWCEANGVTPKLQNQFSQALAGRGYTLTRKRIDGTLKRIITGLNLVTRDAE